MSASVARARAASPLAAVRPAPPDAVLAEDWGRALFACPQDPVHHAEGDVGVHTRMVMEVLPTLPAYRALDDEGRRVVALACLLHDVAKPQTTVVDESLPPGRGRVTARGHSHKGAVRTRQLLFEAGLPWRTREAVCALIRSHQVPFFLVDHDAAAAERRLLQLTLAARADWLAVVAEADMRGRVCADVDAVLERIALFRVMAEDLGVLERPYAFADDHTRVLYFRDERRTRFDTAFDDTVSTVTLLCGLPAAGKNTWIATHDVDVDAVVSLDDIRDEFDIEHGGPQRAVINIAQERMKARLRARLPVVWNATNLARTQRKSVIDLAIAYGARVEVVVVEAGAAAVYARNRARSAPVPASAYERLLARWEFPDASEAHRLLVVDDGLTGTSG